MIDYCGLLDGAEQNFTDTIPTSAELLTSAQESMCNRVTIFACWTTMLAVGIWMFSSWHRLSITNYIPHLIFLVAMWGFYFMRTHFSVAIRSWLLIGAVMLLAVSTMISYGVYSDARILFIIALLTTVGLRGIRAGWLVLGINIILFLTISTAIALGYAPHLEDQPMLNSIVSHTINFIVYSVVGAIFSNFLIRAVSQGWDEQHLMLQHQHTLSSELQSALERESALTASLRISLEQAREVSQMRERLTTVISHQFRTPLAVINLSSQLLNRNDGQLPLDKQRQHFDYITENLEILKQLVNEIVASQNSGNDIDQLLKQLNEATLA